MFKAHEKTKTVPSTFIFRWVLNTYLIQPQISTRTILASDNQIARLDEDNVKTEPQVEGRPYLNQNNFETQMWDLHITMKLLQPHHLQSINNLNNQSLCELQEIEDTPTDLENLCPLTCIQKEGGCDGFKETSRNLKIFLIRVSKNERRTYLTYFVAMSISNGHKTKLDANFVLALSLSFWPINQISEVNSPTHRNLVLT